MRRLPSPATLALTLLPLTLGALAAVQARQGQAGAAAPGPGAELGDQPPGKARSLGARPDRGEVSGGPSPEAMEALWSDGAPGLGDAFRGGRVIQGATPHRMLLFTFDDGPDVHHTPALLDSLDDEGVKAVFFLTASRMAGQTTRQRRQAQIAREIVRRGHLVGSHTLDHLELPTLGKPELRRQIRAAEDIFVEVLGGRPWLLRPPGGGRSRRVDRMIEARGYTQVLWNLGSGDVQVETPEQVLDTWRRVFDRREREDGDGGGIVLLHDIHERSVEAFTLILEDIRRRNCRLLARKEELYDVVDDLGVFFEPRSPGDPPGLEARPALPDPAVLRTRQRRLRRETRARCRARVASGEPAGQHAVDR